MSTLLLLLLGGAALYLIDRKAKAKPVGKLSDEPLDLDNILRGVSEGWYTARPQIMDGFGYVVWLAGKKADGQFYEEVFPIREETYNALIAQGIGKLPKRRIYHELKAAQDKGIDLSAGYSTTDDKALSDLGKRFGYKGSTQSTKPYAQQYYNNLQRAYKAIAGTTLPYKESVVHNAQGDEILRYRDYGTEDQQLQDAIDELSAGVSDSSIYWQIMGDIANKQCKLLWQVSAKEKQAGLKGLADWIIGRASANDRKFYKGVLANKDKGGITPEKYAHRIWESNGMQGDDMRIRDILFEALNTTTDPKEARRMILEVYYDAHKEQEQTFDWSVPSDQQPLFNPDDLQGSNELDMPF